MRRGILLAMLLLVVIPPVVAVNDPGHDSLYVLLVGDSNITGSLNITQTLNATNVRAAGLLYGDQLDIRANGTILSVSSRPAIQSDSADLYLDSNSGNLYLNTQGGVANVVQVGPTSGSSITLNVSGTIRQEGVAVCLSNGTNCISGNNSGNVSSVTAGSGLTDSGTASDPILDVNAGDGISVANDEVIIDNSTVCRSDGTGCPASGGGWINNSVLVHLANNATNVSIGNTTGNEPILFVDTQNERVGIGTISPNQIFEIAGSANITTGNLSLDSTYSMCFNPACSARIYHNGSALIIEGT